MDSGLVRHPCCRRGGGRFAVAALLGACLAAPAMGDDEEVTAGTVEGAIARAVTWLKTHRQTGGHWEVGVNSADRYWAGDSGLALLALLYAGEDARKDDMAASLDWLAAQPLHATYTFGIRAHALALVSGKKYRKRLESDAEWLFQAIAPRGWDNFGMYGYGNVRSEGPTAWVDHSNGQFGVLGLWMACEAGVSPVTDMENYWLMVQDRWMLDQNNDGGWGYRRGEKSTGSMSAAGLTTLYVVLDRAHAKTGHRRANRLIRSIDGALAWFGRQYRPDNPDGDQRWQYYYLYGVERAGRASGRKYFRDRDWFYDGAAELLRLQGRDGAWPPTGGMSSLQNTCFALMFLCHGRAPLVFNKLEHGRDWDVYLRDAAGLTRWCGHAFERLLNWQIVDLRGSVEDLLEAPVLYLSGQREWDFDDAEVVKLREYCMRGGLIFAVVPRGGEDFEASMRKLAERLLPETPLRPLPSGHPLFSGEVQFQIEKPPLLLHVTNGLRTQMLLCTSDVASAWNEYRSEQRAADFQLGANVFLYATDKGTQHSRLDSPLIRTQKVEIAQTIRVARLQYNGPWDIEPYGWTRLRAFMNNSAATRLLVTSGVPLTSLDFKDFKIAHITGTKAFELSEAELAGLRAFLTSGGTLIADGAGGSRAFIESLEKHVTRALNVEPKPLDKESFLITGEGIPRAGTLTGIQYRRAARVASAADWPRLRVFDLGRRLAVIESPLDLSAGLLGTPLYNCNGYSPDSALRIMRNLLLYANLSTAEKAELSKPRQP